MVHHLHHQVEVEEVVVDIWSVEDILRDIQHITLDQMEDVPINQNQEVEINLLYHHHWQLRHLLLLLLPQEKEVKEVIIQSFGC